MNLRQSTTADITSKHTQNRNEHQYNIIIIPSAHLQFSFLDIHCIYEKYYDAEMIPTRDTEGFTRFESPRTD
jgi:hypothetical protein